MSHTAPTRNTLYYGDNLDVLRRYLPDDSVDLIYADPPFNSARDYNVIFKEKGGTGSPAQIQAFKDTWTWDREAAATYRELMVGSQDSRVRAAPDRVQKVLEGFVDYVLGQNALTAYLVMMAARLVECHRVLKPTGTMVLHCDPTASHYLKIVMDAVFGPENFRNEIIWQRVKAKGLARRNLATNHDTIFRYTKGNRWTWNPIYIPHDVKDKRVLKFYKHVEPETGRRYQLDNLVNPNPKRPNLTYEFLGITRVWRWRKARMQAAYDKGLIVQTKPGGVSALKRYLDEQSGIPLGDVWVDIPTIQASSKERLGYPTQKPESLLERIIAASSNPGDVVLDPFCGCGTMVVAAHRLGRHWIGVDITHLSTALLKFRLKDIFGVQAGQHYKLVGEPADVAGARALADQDRYQFQFWALSLVRARPLEGMEDSGKGTRGGKKGADQGIDGKITFEVARNSYKTVVVQVKSGKVGVRDIRDLRGVIERVGAPIGVFITLERPTVDMRAEVVLAGDYTPPGWNRPYPRLQILTIEDLLAGAEIAMPSYSGAHTPAQREADPDAPRMQDMFTAPSDDASPG